MKNFDGEKIETELKKYFGILKDMAFDSFREYQEICLLKTSPYKATTRAMMIRDHFQKKLESSNLFDGVKNRLEEENNTFYIYLENYPITFHKLDKNKRKRKYIDDIKLNIDYNFEQTHLSLGIEIGTNPCGITKEAPLTFGYVLNSVGTEIVGLYLTYQVGKLVKWYRKIDFVKPLSIAENEENNKQKIPRVR